MATEKFTPDKIRSDLVQPLRKLADDFEKAAAELEESFDQRRALKSWLPLNVGGKTSGMKAAFAMLRKFLKKEVRFKLDAANDGSLRYREAELKIGKKSDKPNG